jgi:hypothetical protein
MWKANQSNGFACNKSFYHHHFTGSLKTARKPKKKNKNPFQQICDSPYFETCMEKFQQKCV